MDKITTALFGAIALLPVPAEAPLSETYQWLTDVQSSNNGSEVRLQLRSKPRVRIQQTTTRNEDLKARAFNDEYGAIRRLWGVPMWTQAQYVGQISSGSSVIACNTGNYDYVASSLALIWQDANTFAVVQVDTVAAFSLGLSATVGTTFSAAYVMPLRVGLVSGDISQQRSGFADVSKVSYDLQDPVLTASSAPTQFLSNDIYFDPVLKGGTQYDAAIQSEELRADYHLGAVDYLIPWLYTRTLNTYERVLRNVDEVYAFKQWMHRRAGKFRAFWLPSFENDLRVANATSITTTLRWTKDSYDEWATDRTHVAIEDLSGNWYARTLSSISAFSSTVLQGTLSSSLGGLDPLNIRRISYLGLKRLSSDSVTLNWPGGGVCKTSYGVLEISP